MGPGNKYLLGRGTGRGFHGRVRSGFKERETMLYFVLEHRKKLGGKGRQVVVVVGGVLLSADLPGEGVVRS